jgi:hypothetical protein
VSKAPLVFWRAAGALIGDDEPSAVMVAGMPADAADGMLVSLAGTPENRAYFGATGTGDGSSPFPQLRIVALTARAGRAICGAVLGKSCDGEQTLLRTLASGQPACSRAASPYPAGAAGHVIARVKGGISLPFPDIPDKGLAARRLPGELAERPVREKGGAAPGPGSRAPGPGHLPGREKVPETCTLVTTLLDERAVPVDVLRDPYPHRWTAPETTSGEDMVTIAGAGSRTSARSSAQGPRCSSATRQTVTRKYQVIVYAPGRS